MERSVGTYFMLTVCRLLWLLFYDNPHILILFVGKLNFSAELSTKGCRNNWEKHFEALLLPELEVSVTVTSLE